MNEAVYPAEGARFEGAGSRPLRSRSTAALLALAGILTLPSSRLDAGPNTWTSIGLAGTEVKALAVSPASGSTIAAGTPSGYAVTKNGGATWTTVSTGYETNALAFDPSDPSIVYAATGGALARSADGGATYTPVVLDSAYCVAIDPTSPLVVYAGTTDHVYKSVDRGLHWTPVFTGPGHSFVNAIAVDPVDPRVVWAGMTFGGLQKSTNGGASWSAVSGSVPMGISAIAVHPTASSTVLVLGMSGVSRTTDGGATWSSVANLWGSDGDLVADRAAPGTFYAAGSNGVVHTADAGATWNHLDSGLTNLDVQALAIDPSDHTRLYAGTNGGGVFAMAVGSGGGPTLRVTSPNGGEVWQAGTTHAITWTSTSVANVKIEYSTTSPWDGQLVDPKTIVASVPSTGSYPWVVPQAMSPVCHVRVSDVDGSTSDTSDAPFQIVCHGTMIDASPGQCNDLEAGRAASSIWACVGPGSPCCSRCWPRC